MKATEGWLMQMAKITFEMVRHHSHRKVYYQKSLSKVKLCDCPCALCVLST